MLRWVPAIALLLAIPALADVVHLKDGKIIEGRARRESGG